MPRMDFELSEDQSALQEAASALLEDMSQVSRVREVSSSDSRLDEKLWRAMADQGWLAVERSEEDGGLGMGMVEVVVLAEAVGRHLAAVPFSGTLLAAGALSEAVSSGEVGRGETLGDKTVEQHLESLSNAQEVGAIAWAKPASARVPRATPDADGGWRLSGRIGPVVYGPAAHVLVVFAESAGDGGSPFALALEDRERPPPQPAMDVTRTLSWVELDRARAIRLGGSAAAASLLDRAATICSAEMLGAASRVLEMTVDYAKTRVQFGRPIGSFQAVKHRCADMLVDVEGMRSSVYFAAWAVGACDPQAQLAASAAKVWCSDAASRVMASALQVHGGVGFTWEHDLHLFLKRSELDQVSYGDAVFHRERLARMLRAKVRAQLPIL